jgi:hypothetical protein
VSQRCFGVHVANSGLDILDGREFVTPGVVQHRSQFKAFGEESLQADFHYSNSLLLRAGFSAVMNSGSDAIGVVAAASS